MRVKVRLWIDKAQLGQCLGRLLSLVARVVEVCAS
jgi:hypothetical protein